MIYFTAVGMMNALGDDVNQIANNLRTYSQHPENIAAISQGMHTSTDYLLHDKPCMVGAVTALLPPIPDPLMIHNSRNNQLLLGTLNQIESSVQAVIHEYGSARLAIIIGTSTSGIDEGDHAVHAYIKTQKLPETYHYQQQELGDPALFLADYLGTHGPAYSISTACSSSSRAFISGMRMIESGLVDAALVGGVDTLCRMAINGFDSLESLSSERCQPFAKARDGINIGEGAALILLTKKPAKIALLGVGESSDAHHMSAPHPEGIGAERAMRMALDHADLKPDDIGYINLHGTATRLNDTAESKAIYRIFGNTTPCSSIKHLTGHTLGAAGATGAALSWLLLDQNIPLPAQDFNVSPRDPDIAAINLIDTFNIPFPMIDPLKPVILSNAFAFGGNNTALILGACE